MATKLRRSSIGIVCHSLIFSSFWIAIPCSPVGAIFSTLFSSTHFAHFQLLLSTLHSIVVIFLAVLQRSAMDLSLKTLADWNWNLLRDYFLSDNNIWFSQTYIIDNATTFNNSYQMDHLLQSDHLPNEHLDLGILVRFRAGSTYLPISFRKNYEYMEITIKLMLRDI